MFTSQKYFTFLYILLQDEQVAWVAFHRRKWTLQRLQREAARESRRQLKRDGVNVETHRKSAPQSGLDGFFQKHTRSILETPWEIIQVLIRFSSQHLLKNANLKKS